MTETATAPKGINAANITDWFRENIEGAEPPLTFTMITGGHSNLTYFARIGDREMVLRRPPFGSRVKSAHDMGREYTILSHIHDVYGPAPEPLR